jgi:predicted kinase
VDLQRCPAGEHYREPVARLVLINGAPCSGKSTLARRYAAEHPLALALDIDVVRGMFGGWLDQPTDAGLIARRLALAMARVQLSEGRDVLVPQFLGRVDFVVELQALGDDVGATFVEVALLADPHDLVRRFAHRTAQAASPEHAYAAALLARSGGTAALQQLHQQLLEVVARRPGTCTVQTTDGGVEQAYVNLLTHLGT